MVTSGVREIDGKVEKSARSRAASAERVVLGGLSQEVTFEVRPE